MKVSKEKAAENRAAIVTAAGRLFRERGFDKVGVAEITKAAGLTHGGFYGHFASKDALAAEACEAAFAESLDRLPADEASAEGALAAFLTRYLSERHRDHPEAGCPMAAFAGEMARLDPAVQDRFGAGVERFFAAVAARLPADGGAGDAGRRARAIAIVSALVGGMALARATARTGPELSLEILDALRTQLGAWGDGQG
ncbi:TetR/AcrR family transcriptional repressor of nem operon [Azospirillum fermentarium]|uniref:TetR/AcrR family transcriptional regulator n=1 Tax=Azospirillum fermentarium TaxID=1233114 RepID=UPI00222764FB|nr:TetR/AcrR family transcriptional regulator [Azospirillum fermentarium]MCW2249008.1 TetR/AcrR family transcriptional repressor of nem operon [Azospirillum fermentarium]